MDNYRKGNSRDAKLIRSMTGYGRGEIEEKGVRITVELRSFNNRFLEITMKLPRFLTPLESEVKNMIHTRISRGRIIANIGWDESEGLGESIKLDEEVADRYYSLFQNLKQRYGLPGEVDLQTFAMLPDLFKREAEEWEPAEALPFVMEALSIALDDLMEMKEREGEAIAGDIASRMDATLAYLENIESRLPQRVDELRQRLKTRLAEICDQSNCDEALLAQEVVLFAERSDFTEECVRYRVHLENFKRYLIEGGVVGRKLNFLLQEMAREVNTMGAKAADATVSSNVVLIKEELEKIREQVQNIE